jgi:uncharacterized protein (UPF0212 family)
MGAVTSQACGASCKAVWVALKLTVQKEIFTLLVFSAHRHIIL